MTTPRRQIRVSALGEDFQPPDDGEVAPEPADAEPSPAEQVREEVEREPDIAPEPSPVEPAPPEQVREETERARRERLATATPEELDPRRAPAVAGVEGAPPVPAVSIEVAPAERPAGSLRRFWRSLTPWTEEAGDTFASHVKGWPGRVADDWRNTFQRRRPPDQATLQAQFEAEQSAPRWLRLLLGNTVTRHRDGTFSPIVVGVVDLPVGPAGVARGGSAARRIVEVVRRTARTLGPDDVRMTPGQFTRFVQARVRDPKLTPEAFKASEAIETVTKRGLNVDWDLLARDVARGEVNNADDVARWISRNARPAPPPPGAGASPAQLAREAARKGTTQTDIEKMVKAFDASVKAKQLSQARLGVLPIFTPYLNPNTGPASTWRPFKPGQLTEAAIRRLNEGWSNIEANEAIRQMTDSNLAEIAAVSSPETIIRGWQNAAPGWRRKLIETVSPAVGEAIQTANAEEVKVAAQESVAASVAVSTVIQTATETTTAAITEAPPARPPRRAPRRPAAPPAGVAAGVPLPPRFAVVKGRKERRRRVGLRPGPVAWRQGFIWITASPPFQTQADVTFSRRKPAGVRIVSGPGSAAKSIRRLGGDPDVALKIDLGIVDIELTAKGRKKPRLRFKADPKQRTRGDITVKRIR